jgi:hypothetical protein
MEMSNVFSAHAVSVDGYIRGRDPSDGDGGFGRGLGDAGMLFDWYFDGETPSQVFGGFRLSEPSARFFDALAARVGAALAGRTTYEHSSHFGGGSPHPTARLFVLSHRRCRRSASGRPSSPPASRARSRRRVRPLATRTSVSWAAAS